ncbi:mechanosensitive ion channel, putative [Babesia ovata]|uniref:Mechanosensitive ion channel, putative n=1 Tax=Babesia ovata TaxID=189622 RepID=A0A2H6KAL3_9APIC|nr:mechanosensitive ion channel, putative [Babesia ovata]GBE60025.1 mechanosensitive ion channel, putative [Babesia ovata]
MKRSGRGFCTNTSMISVTTEIGGWSIAKCTSAALRRVRRALSSPVDDLESPSFSGVANNSISPSSAALPVDSGSRGDDAAAAPVPADGSTGAAADSGAPTNKPFTVLSMANLRWATK